MQSRPSTAQTWFRAVALALTLFMPPLVLNGCGGDEAETAGTETAAADKLDASKSKAQDAKAAAEQANAPTIAKKEWEEALDMFEKAEGYEADGKTKTAEKRFRTAGTRFEKALKAAKDNEKSLAKVNGKIAEYEKLKGEATQLMAEKLDPDGWRYATEQFARAKEQLDEGKLSNADKTLNRAISDMESSIRVAGEKVAVKKEVEELMVEVATRRQEAEAAKAEQHVPNDMIFAADEVRNAEKAMASADYDTALDHLRSARTTLVSALLSAKQLAQAANAGANIGNARPVRTGGLDGGNDSTPAPEVGEIPIPTGGDGGGDVDLATGLLDLFSVSPDYANGVLTLEYGLGPDFRKDVEILKGREYLHFEGEEGVGSGVEEYVFASNTEGLFFLNAGFEDGVQVEFDLQVQLCLPDNPFFWVAVMAEETNSYYASNFGTDILIIESKRVPKRVPSANSEYNQHPNKWTSKRDPKRIKIRYRKANEDDKGILQTFYDGEQTGEIKTDKYRNGRIGFAWHNVKFYVKNLSVKGYLDEDWARETIKKGKPVGGDGDGDGDGFDF